MMLPIPPSYEYQTAGPWFVTHTVNDRIQAWTLWTLESAIIRFWHYEPELRPTRRVMVDGRGIMILGTDISDGVTMVGTRETMEATLRMTEKQSGTDDALEVLTMVETVRIAMEGS